jgi:hypothetical protein
MNEGVDTNHSRGAVAKSSLRGREVVAARRAMPRA